VSCVTSKTLQELKKKGEIQTRGGEALPGRSAVLWAWRGVRWGLCRAPGRLPGRRRALSVSRFIFVIVQEVFTIGFLLPQSVAMLSVSLSVKRKMNKTKVPIYQLFSE